MYHIAIAAQENIMCINANENKSPYIIEFRIHLDCIQLRIGVKLLTLLN